MSETVKGRAVTPAPEDAAEIFAAWLSELVDAVESNASSELEQHLAEDVTVRDLMAFRWDFSNAIGSRAVAKKFVADARESDAGDFRVNEKQPPIVIGDRIYGFFDFTSRDRVNRGHAQLVADDGRYVAAILQTQVMGLAAYPEFTGPNRREGKVHGVVPKRTRWKGDREQESAFEDEDPVALILGAGHCGLAVAARLGALGVPTLVFDKEARVGDNWRNRYPSLALHSPVYGDQMPYLDLPDTWPAHTPKDKLGDWFECYAKLLDLNVWTSTSFIKGHYDEDAERWTIYLRRGDRSIRELHPRHFIVAGGVFGDPKIPDVKGLDTFPGLYLHSDSYQDGVDVAGKKALVVGAAVSGHELAHDLWEQGADVTMVQRGETWVITFQTNAELWSPLLRDDMVMPKEFIDQATHSILNARADDIGRDLVKKAEEIDKDLIERLEQVGFKIKRGPEVTGVPGAHMAGTDAYQIDVGASQLVADRRIHLKQGVEIREIRGNSVTFTDGTDIDVDLIVFATGYHQFWGHMKPILGPIAEKIDKVYGRAADGEYANTWRRSEQPGLWFASGFLRMVSLYSSFMALLIKAIEEGIEPMDPGRPAEGAPRPLASAPALSHG